MPQTYWVAGTAATNAVISAHCAVAVTRVVTKAIGQGDCHQFQDSTGTPILYFDTGAGCVTHSQSYTAAHTDTNAARIAFAGTEKIVLSHWDEDHWWQAAFEPGTGSRSIANARADGGALAQTWFAPRARVSATAQNVAQEVGNRGGSVRLWSYGTYTPGMAIPSITINTGTGTIELTRGDQDPASDPNNSGILLTVKNTANTHAYCITGDVQFQYMPAGFPARSPQTVNGFTAPHHGSDTHFTAGDVAQRPGLLPSNCVVSVGAPNHHNLPKAAVLTHYGTTRGFTVLRTDPVGVGGTHSDRTLATLPQPAPTPFLGNTVFWFLVRTGAAALNYVFGNWNSN